MMFLFKSTPVKSQETLNEIASIVSNIVRKHKQAWGVEKSKKLYTRESISNDMDIKLRTLYRIPNRGTSIAAYLDYTTSLGEFITGKYTMGIVFTNEGIYIRGGEVKSLKLASYLSYEDINQNITFNWTSYYLTLSRENSKIPDIYINLLYCKVDAPYIANLIEETSEIITSL